jgi:DNA polymerase elongation subunit (family B)
MDAEYETVSDLEFVPTSYHDVDEVITYEEDGLKKTYKSYVIYMFGRMENGESLTLKIEDYNPSFTIRIPDTWKKNECQAAIAHFKKIYTTKIKKGAQESDIVRISIEKHHDLAENFCDGKLFRFMKFRFRSVDAYHKFRGVFYNRIKVPNVMKQYELFETYEHKLHSILGFIIDTKINSANWNLVKDAQQLDDSEVTTDWYYSSSYKNISAIEEERDLPPIKTTAYDIECISEDGTFPQPGRCGDKIVSICATTSIYGSEKIVRTDVIGLKSSSRINDVNMQIFDNEKELLLAWKNVINEIDVDIILGFNTFGFDNKYTKVKAEQPYVNCEKEFSKMSRLLHHKCKFIHHTIQSAGLGDNEMDFYQIPGRNEFDLMKLIQQEMSFTEYSLNKSCENIMRSKIKVEMYDKSKKNKSYLVKVNSKEKDVAKDNYIKFIWNNFVCQKKHKVLESWTNDDGIQCLIVKARPDYESKHVLKSDFICLAKDDMPISELFESFDKGPKERKKIHQYCVQDCALLNKLCHRVDFVTQKMALANVAGVPLDYIILKGQGIKTLALFTKFCRTVNYIIKDVKSSDEKLGYEGATVLDPIRGFYERPLTTLDFNSLYPSAEISYDMSHETLVTKDEYMDLPDYHYRTVPFDETVAGEKTGKKIVATFATRKENVDKNGNQRPGMYGIVGTILDKLLKDRKVAKKNMKIFPDKKKIYNGQQKALKVTANSIYGQLGSSFSQVGLPIIAAATTAVGRDLLELGMRHVEDEFEPITRALYNAWKTGKNKRADRILDKELEDRDNKEFIKMMKETIIELYDSYTIDPIVAYGDTDSNFIDFKIQDMEGEMPINRWCRIMCMKLGEIESKLLKGRLPHPNNMAYEKVIQPCVLMEPKNYLGLKYEDNPDKYSMMVMGFKLKRRDGSIVFQKILGGAIDIALKDTSPNKAEKALRYLEQCMIDLLDEKYDVEDFITTRLLKAKYGGLKLTTDAKGDEDDVGNLKDRTGWDWYDVKRPPAHVMLCQNMRHRDPGNVPQTNSRIPYVYVVKPNSKNLLVGERIEHPDYIKKNNVKIDYLYYITNQIKNSAVQFFKPIEPNIEQIFDDIVAKGTEINVDYVQGKIIENTTESFKEHKVFKNKNDDDGADIDDDDFMTKLIHTHKYDKVKSKKIQPNDIAVIASKAKTTLKKAKRKGRFISTKNISVKSIIAPILDQ